MYLEIYLAITILCDINKKEFEINNNHKIFYYVMCLLTLF